MEIFRNLVEENTIVFFPSKKKSLFLPVRKCKTLASCSNGPAWTVMAQQTWPYPHSTRPAVHGNDIPKFKTKRAS